MGTCSEEEEVDGALDEDEGNLIYRKHRKCHGLYSKFNGLEQYMFELLIIFLQTLKLIP